MGRRDGLDVYLRGFGPGEGREEVGLKLREVRKA